jgi:glutamate dehydrogenase
VQILSQEVARAAGRAGAYEDLMAELEAEGLLDRAVEFLPGSDEMAERGRAGSGLTRPELCVLLAYAKLSLKGTLLASTLPDDPYLESDLRRYFPPRVVEELASQLSQHPLRRELVATIMANDIVNSEGITFVSRTARETGARPDEIARAYRIARETTNAAARWGAVEALDGKIDPVVQNELMTGVDWLVEKTSRWYLRHAPAADLGSTIEEARAAFAELSDALPSIGPESWRLRCREAARRLEAEGVPAEVAIRHAFQPELVHAPDILAVARELGAPIPDVARVFLLVGQALHVDWLESRLEELPAASRWDRWALNAVEEDLLNVRREAAERALSSENGKAPEAAVEAWLAGRAEARERLERLMRELDAEGVDELSAVTVAVRQIRGVTWGNPWFPHEPPPSARA